MQLPDVFIATLMRDKERVEHVQNVLIPSLQSAEFPRIHVHEAVDGKSDALRQALVAEKMGIDEKYGRSIGVGQLGCYMSHYLIWKRALAAGLEDCIVLEDDAVFLTSKQHMVDLLHEARKFDFVYLFTAPSHYKNDARVQLPFHTHLNNVYWQYGTVAYYVTRKGMETMLAELHMMACNVDEAIMKLVKGKLRAASCKVIPFGTVGQISGYLKDEKFRSNIHHSKNASAIVSQVREALKAVVETETGNT